MTEIKIMMKSNLRHAWPMGRWLKGNAEFKFEDG